MSNSSDKFDKLNLLNLSKLFHKYAKLIDKFIKVLVQTLRAGFPLAIMLWVSFPPLAQVFCVYCEKPGTCASINNDYVIMSLRRTKKRPF